MCYMDEDVSKVCSEEGLRAAELHISVAAQTV